MKPRIRYWSDTSACFAIEFSDGSVQEYNFATAEEPDFVLEWICNYFGSDGQLGVLRVEGAPR